MAEHNFDKWQEKAIEISGGRHLVLASPGCGKTDILTERVVHAHQAGMPYADMLCLTFTNRAAKGMAQRISDRTGNPIPDDLFVGNIHRYCSQMLFAEGIVGANSAIIDEGDVDSIIQEELCRRLEIQSRTTELVRYQHLMWQLEKGMRGELLLHNELLQTTAISKLCTVMQVPCNEDSIAGIYADINNIVRHSDVVNELPAAATLRLARAYQQYKTDNDLLDYDDLLIMAYLHLTRADNQASTLHHYRWIEVDEVQDLNALQLELINLLATPDATIVYLGDEQQAIFSFIGAKLETLEKLKQHCGNNIHRLYNNYRSPRYLLDLQNDFASRNLHIDNANLPAAYNDIHHQPEDLCLLETNSSTSEIEYATRFAARYGQTNNNGRVAILVSTNFEADLIGDAMSKYGISHFKISGTDLFSRPEVRLLIAHLTVATDESVFIAWARLLWGLHIFDNYTLARNFMRNTRSVALLPTDFLLYPNSSYLQEFTRICDNEEIIIFDTETTGLDTDNDDIIQIAAIRVRNGKQVGKSFNIILETDKELPTTVGGHPNPMLEVYANSRRYPRAEGLRLFMDYCRGHVLVGHNVNYDYTILNNNLRRSCPDIVLADECPRYFDTLKYIRLVRPRLRQYKLGHLLEVLHLEGQNSHQADDDIMATLNLMNFCHLCAAQIIPEQLTFLSMYSNKISDFKQRYHHLYTHAIANMDNGSENSIPALVAELDYAYRTLLSDGMIPTIDKWGHLINYLTSDLIRIDLFPTLRSQLERYITDLNTGKEADMCSNSLNERFVISTVHKAKGLEFDTVIVLRATDGKYPSQHSMTEKQIQEDARRLFVAISRSRKQLCITYNTENGAHLSPFLQQVKQYFTHFELLPDGKVRPSAR